VNPRLPLIKKKNNKVLNAQGSQLSLAPSLQSSRPQSEMNFISKAPIHPKWTSPLRIYHKNTQLSLPEIEEWQGFQMKEFTQIKSNQICLDITNTD
jgi:hypothetical protein